MRNLAHILLSASIVFAGPALAQTTNANGVPVITPQAGDVYFRVPLQGNQTSNATTYGWVEDVSSCSTQCGTGTRTKSYQCQDLSSIDFVGGTGFGAAESSSLCVSAAGAAPATTTEACTVYSGCNYTWVTPAVTQAVSAISPYPAGRIGCGQVRVTYSPYCQRSDGLVLSSADNAYCKNAANYPSSAAAGSDAFGYDRTEIQTASCTTSDQAWTSGSWSAWSSTCSDAATRTRAVTCTRNFDGTVQPDSSCNAATKPTASETAGQYGSCSYTWNSSAWSAWSSTCSNSATRTRSVTCLRSDGTTVVDSFCSAAGAKPTTSEVSAQYGSCTYSWSSGAWDTGAASCTANETQTRPVTCKRDLDGVTVADTSCNAGTKPATTQSVPDYSGCSFAWQTGGWSASSSTCSASAVQTRAVWCQRSDGTTAADASCTGVKPTSSQIVSDYSGCGYAAGGTITNGTWSSTCSATATRTNTSQCVRSDGTVVPSTECTSRGVSLTSTEVGANYSGCGYTWQTGSWSAWDSTCSNSAVQTRAVWCQRSDGTTVADANCTATKPSSTNVAAQYGSCTYSWTTSAWNTGVASCTANETQTRTVTCKRDLDGVTVADTSCNAGTKPASTQSVPDYSGCGYTWQTGGWSASSSTCSGSAVQTRAVWCQRSDGTTVADASCTGTKPSASQVLADYSGCGYAAGGTITYGTWSSTCSATATRTNTSQCVRSDGSVVASTECSSRGISLTSTETAGIYSGCGYTWQTGGWSAWDSTCSNAAVQTRAVWCQRSDGTTVADANCTATKPSSTNVAAQYGSCTYSWTTSAWDTGVASCTANETQTRTVTCKRDLDGLTVADTSCNAGTRPASTQSVPDYSGCGFTWQTGGWSAPSSTCSASAVQTRAVWCQRSDGTTAADASCTGTKPSASQVVADYSTCSYSPGGSITYGTWSSTCSASATRSVTRQCVRSDGSVVASTECTSRGISLTSSETTGIYSGCGYTWQTGAWSAWSSTCSNSAVQTRAVWCQRSDGTTVADTSCDAASKPSSSNVSSQYGSCSYSWTAGAWDTGAASCTASELQTRSVTCKRDLDGATVVDSNCNAGTKPATSQSVPDYSGCGFTWQTGGWSASSSTCSGSAVQTRAVWCQRSDGTTASDASCTGTKPSASQTVADYSGCGYTWQTGGWSASSSTCSGSAVQTRAVWCQRSDGATVADASCTAAKPNASQVVADYSSCSYGPGGSVSYGAWSSTCSASATRSVTSQCVRSDGSVVASTECTNRGISLTSSETAAVYSGCSFSWQVGSWSAWSSTCSSSAVRTRAVTCVRSDGTVASDASCAAAKPATSETAGIYDTCTINLTYTDSTCTNNVITRTNTCTRSDGTPLDPQTYCGVPSSQSIACVSTVNGVCGPSVTNKCLAGTATRGDTVCGVSTWQCMGSGGGTDATCSAGWIFTPCRK